MTHSVVWITYTVLCEVMMKIGPCILLVALNVCMIQVHIRTGNAYIFYES